MFFILFLRDILDLSSNPSTEFKILSITFLLSQSSLLFLDCFFFNAPFLVELMPFLSYLFENLNFVMILFFVPCVTCFLGVLSLLGFLKHESAQFSILIDLPVADAVGAMPDSL